MHIAAVISSVVAENNEILPNSHMMWLHRQYTKVLLRQLELDRREKLLLNREKALNNSQRTARPTPRGAGRRG